MTSFASTILTDINTVATHGPQHEQFSSTSPATIALQKYAAASNNTKTEQQEQQKQQSKRTNDSASALMEDLNQLLQHTSETKTVPSSVLPKDESSSKVNAAYDSVLISPSSSGSCLYQALLDQPNRQEENVKSMDVSDLLKATVPVEAAGTFPVIEWDYEEEDNVSENNSQTRRRKRTSQEFDESESSDEEDCLDYNSLVSLSRKRGRRNEPRCLQRSRALRNCLATLASEKSFQFETDRYEDSSIVGACSGPATRALALQLSPPQPQRAVNFAPVIPMNDECRSQPRARSVSWGQFIETDEDEQDNIIFA